MNKILMLTYFSAPDGGAVFHRTIGFARYLAQFGFEAHIMTSGQGRKTLSHMKHKCDKAANGCALVDDPIQNIPTFAVKLLSNMFLPDKQILWAKKVVKAATKYIRSNQIDLFFVVAPPYSNAFVAQSLKTQLNVPVVIDFCEAWDLLPNIYKWRKQEAMISKIKKALSSADYLITSTETAKKHLISLIRKPLISVIRNSFDPNMLEYNEIDSENRKRLTFAHIGSLNTYNSPVTFFKILQSLVLTGDIHKEHLDIMLYGKNNPAQWEMMFENIASRFNFLPYADYEKYIQKAAEADILLLFCTNMPDSVNLASTLFEYMMLKKPILAIVDNQNELTDILNNYGNAYIIQAKKLDEGKKVMLDIYSKWKQHQLHKDVSEEYVNSFNCFARVRELATLLSHVIEKSQQTGKPQSSNSEKPAQVSQAS